MEDVGEILKDYLNTGDILVKKGIIPYKIIKLQMKSTHFGDKADR